MFAVTIVSADGREVTVAVPLDKAECSASNIRPGLFDNDAVHTGSHTSAEHAFTTAPAVLPSVPTLSQQMDWRAFSNTRLGKDTVLQEAVAGISDGWLTTVPETKFKVPESDNEQLLTPSSADKTCPDDATVCGPEAGRVDSDDEMMQLSPDVTSIPAPDDDRK